jgi:competence protein ComEC
MIPTRIYRILALGPDPDPHLRAQFLPCWALLWLLGTSLGRYLPPFNVAQALASGLTILSCLSPLALLIRSRAGVWLFITLTVGATALHEAQRICVLDALPVSAAENRWSPSRIIKKNAAVKLRTTSWPRRRGQHWQTTGIVQAVADSTGLSAPRENLRGDRLLLNGKGEVPAFGSVCIGRLELQSPGTETVPDGFSMRRFLRGRQIDWRARSDGMAAVERSGVAARCEVEILKQLGRLRSGILQTFRQLYPRRESILLASVLLGEKTSGLRDVKSPFTDLGLGHLFAVSGLHVGLIAGLVALLIKPFGPGPHHRWLIMAVVLAMYVLLSGMASSTIRAASLTVVGLSGPLLGVRIDSLRLLALLFWASLVWSADLGVDAGFRLSYMAAAGIVLGLRLITPLVESLPAAWRWLAISLSVSLSAQWATLPEVTAAFGWLNLMAPLYNLLAVPVFGAAVSLAVISLLLSFVPWIAAAVSALAWTLLRGLEVIAFLLNTATRIKGLPAWGPLQLTVYLLTTTIFIHLLHRARLWSVTRRLLLLGTLVLMGSCVLFLMSMEIRRPAMRAWQLDVGQGDCALLIFPDHTSVMIDTGDQWRNGGSPFAMAVAPWLKRHGIREIEALVLTHHHADHDGAWRQVMQQVSVRRIWQNRTAALADSLCPDGTTLVIPSAGDTLHSVDGWLLRCLYSTRESPLPDNENDRSLVLELRFGDRLLGLWMGDLESEGEAHLLHHLAGPIDVLKAGHHGSRTSSSQAFLEAVAPQTVLISCGVENRHKHPSHGCFLAQGDTLTLMRTDLDGSLLVSWDENGRYMGCMSSMGDKSALSP